MSFDETLPLPAIQYSVGWISALPIEHAAACEMLDEEHPVPVDIHQNDNSIYRLGRMGNHNVVIACLPAGQTGTVSAATLTVQMKSSFPALRFGLMVGIGGGVPSVKNDVRLGDVVVSQPDGTNGGVIQYDFGKARPGGFERTGVLSLPPPVLLNALAICKSNCMREKSNFEGYLARLTHLPRFSRDNAGPDILYESIFSHNEGRSCEESCEETRAIKRKPRLDERPVVHYGTIASGNQVIRDGVTRDKLSADMETVLCFEMEAAGLMNSFPSLIIRGISDYADSHKTKTWQPYAAASAAAFGREILDVIPTEEIASSRTIDQTIEKLSKERLNSDIEDAGSEVMSLLHAEKQTVPRLSPEDWPENYWIFRNADYLDWKHQQRRLLGVTGPAERNLDRISSSMIDLERRNERKVLYFFCSQVMETESMVPIFVHTVLSQLCALNQEDGGVLVLQEFLRELSQRVSRIDDNPIWTRYDFCKSPPLENLRRVIYSSQNSALWSALLAALLQGRQRQSLLERTLLPQSQPQQTQPQQIQKFTLVVDGILEGNERTQEFTNNLSSFLTHVSKEPNIRVFLTSTWTGQLHTQLESCIEYDRERRECLDMLAFRNSRYEKISEEHEGSFDWLWKHKNFEKWSKSKASQLLYVQGKPGSGKSTIARYYHQHIKQSVHDQKESAIVAGFFYSYREGPVEMNHRNMLQYTLFHILSADEAFFYHRFQEEYRRVRRVSEFPWDYRSLKKLLWSLSDYPRRTKIYFTFDAIDESEITDQRDILQLLVNLCLSSQWCILKIFATSRPLPSFERLLSQPQFHSSFNFIRLQDETKRDIRRFADSFLTFDSPTFLEKARSYIVNNAQGVFLWVRLVKMELQAYDDQGRCEGDMLEFLEGLPTELEQFYMRMLNLIGRSQADLTDGRNMFSLVLFAKRPLTVNELLHAIAMINTPNEQTQSCWGFEKRIPSERRIIHCGGNFLEIKEFEGKRIVQIIHQTVREFFLREDGLGAQSSFQMDPESIYTRMYSTCARYITLCSESLADGCDVRDTQSLNFDDYTHISRHFDKRPFASYAICYLKQHEAEWTSPNGNDTKLRLDYSLSQDPITSSLVRLAESLANDGEAGFLQPALISAVSGGLPVATELYLHLGGDPDSCDARGMPMIAIAAYSGHLSVVETLIYRCNASTFGRGDKFGRTPLIYASQQGHDSIVKTLLELPDISCGFTDRYARTSLHHAAFRGHSTVVNTLLRAGADADTVDVYGWRPLTLTAALGHAPVVQLLVDSEAVDPDRADGNGRTALSWAAGQGHEDVVRVLLSQERVNASFVDSYGNASYMTRMNDMIMKLLLAHTDIHETGYLGSVFQATSTLQTSVGRGYVPELNVSGWTPIVWAQVGNHSDIVKLLQAHQRTLGGDSDAAPGSIVRSLRSTRKRPNHESS